MISKNALILEILKKYIWSDELKKEGRMNPKDFIRERILTFPMIILFLVNLAKKSLQVSLNEFCNLSNLLHVTKQGFSKARIKLSAKVFILLNNKLIEEYYTKEEYRTWKDFRIIGIDGSDIQLPQKENLKKKYGQAKNQNGSGLAMAKISEAYDVLNNIVLDAQIDVYKASERDLAIRHIEAIKKHNHDKTNDLYIYDRGYPSLGLLFYHKENNKNFLMRCTISSCFGKVKEAFHQGKEDVIIRLYAKDANDDQIKDLKERTPRLDRKTAFIDLRVIVVELVTGEKELLITSLLDQKLYLKEDFYKLYGSRWGSEENYKWQKGAFELENFSGNTEIAIEQDFFSLIFTANVASLMIQEAQEELKMEHETKEFKHNYKINKRMAIPTLRDRLIKSLLDPTIGMEAFCSEVKTEIKKYICPERKNRKYERSKKNRRKYGCTTRSCI